MHKARTNRKRKLAERKVPKKLTQEEQEKIRLHNAKMKAYRYPKPPEYKQPSFGAKGKI